jgi:hypothetical protein
VETRRNSNAWNLAATTVLEIFAKRIVFMHKGLTGRLGGCQQKQRTA